MSKTKLYPRAEDLGKNAYRKRTYYTLLVEQDVLAKNQDEADRKNDYQTSSMRFWKNEDIFA